MKQKLRKISALVLAMILTLQFTLQPIFASSNQRTNTPATIMTEGSNSFMEEDTSLGDNLDQDMPNDDPTSLQTQTIIETENQENGLEEELNPEISEISENLKNGESKIIHLPKTAYLTTDNIDLHGIEIVSKTKSGEVLHLFYDDLITNPDIKITPDYEDSLSFYYTNKLLDHEFIANETKPLQDEIKKYIKENKIENIDEVISIQIPEVDSIQIDINIEDELDLKPLELLNAIRLDKNATMLLGIGRLTYRYGEEINLDNIRILLKDKRGKFKIITDRDLGDNFSIDYSAIERDLEKIKEKNNPTKDNQEPIQTHITLSKEGYKDLYIPITIVTEETDISQIDSTGNLNVTTWGVLSDKGQAIFTTTFDIKSVSDIKDIKLDFSSLTDTQSNSFTIDRIVKTDGKSTEDISLSDPIYRDKSNANKYEGFTKEELKESLQKLEITNPIELSKALIPGNKYILYIKMERPEQFENNESQLSLNIETISTDVFSNKNLKLTATKPNSSPLVLAEEPKEASKIEETESNPKSEDVKTDEEENKEEVSDKKEDKSVKNPSKEMSDKVEEDTKLDPTKRNDLLNSKNTDPLSEKDKLISKDESISSQNRAFQLRSVQLQQNENSISPMALTGGRDVNSLVTLNNFTIATSGTTQNEVRITSAQYIKISADYKLDNSIKTGDYFTINYGSVIKPGGLVDPPNINPLFSSDGQIIAIGSYNKETNTVTYTFTSYVDNKMDIKGHFEVRATHRRETYISDADYQSFTVTAAGKTYQKSMIFKYGFKSDIKSGVWAQINTNRVYEQNRSKYFDSFAFFRSTNGPLQNVKITTVGISENNIEFYFFQNQPPSSGNFMPDITKGTRIDPTLQTDGTYKFVNPINGWVVAKIKSKDDGTSQDVKITVEQNVGPNGSHFPGYAYAAGSFTGSIEGSTGLGVNKANFKVKKVDDKKVAITSSWAEFVLYSSKKDVNKADIPDQEITRVRTENGLAIITDLLENGTYFIFETSAPEGFKLTDKGYKIQVKTNNGKLMLLLDNVIKNPDGSIKQLENPGGGYIWQDIGSELSIVNTPKNSTLSIVKTNEAGDKNLAGAEFSLVGNNETKTGTTDDYGKLTFSELKLGEYTLTETKAPAGYVNNEGPRKVVVKEDGKINVTPTATGNLATTYAIDSPKQGMIQYQYNSTNYNFLQVTNTLTPIAGSNNFKLQVDYVGQLNTAQQYKFNIAFNINDFDIESNGQKIGTFEDRFAPFINNRYSSGRYEFTVSPKNPKNGVKISPISEVTYNKLSSLPSTAFPSITPKIVETKPETKELSDIGNNTYEYKISNKLAKYNAEFKKVSRENPDDSTKDIPLGNVEFSLFKKDNTEKYIDTGTKVKSDSTDGSIKLTDLLPGEYELHEVSAPKGYIPIEGSAKTFKIKLDSYGSVEVKDDKGDYQPLNDANKKIINRRIGSEEISFTKKDGSNILPGATFILKDSQGDKVGEAISGSDGKVTFKDLLPGEYYISEIKAPNGYILNTNETKVLVGAEFALPTDLTKGKDVSDYVTLTSGSIGSYDEKNNLRTDGINEPINVGYFKAYSNYTFQTTGIGKEIKPGDYFKVKIGDKLSIGGITPEKQIDDLTISSDMGLVAKGFYDPLSKTITYYFTDYVGTYLLKNASTAINLYVDRKAVLVNTDNFNVSISLLKNGGPYKIDKNFNIRYNNYFSKETETGFSIGSMFAKNDGVNKSYTSYAYINPAGQSGLYNTSFSISTRDGVKDIFDRNTRVRVYQVPLGVMVPSYGFEEDKDGNPIFKYPNGQIVSGKKIEDTMYNNVPNPNLYKVFTLNDGTINENYGVIVKIDGKYPDNAQELKININAESTKDFRKYQPPWYDGYYWHQGYYYNDAITAYMNTYTYLALQTNSSSATGDRNFTVTNFTNKILFKKIGEGDKILEGVNFVLRKKGESSTLQSKTSDKEGLFYFEKLDPGDYEVWETKAPARYVTPDKPVASFSINAKTGEVENITPETRTIRNSMETSLDIIKKDKNKDEKGNDIFLKDAVFSLYKTSEGTKELISFEDFNKLGDKSQYLYKYNNVSEFKTGADGKVTIKGLTDGTYWLQEIKTPEGYLPLKGFIGPIIVKDGVVTYERKENDRLTISYDKNKGTNIATIVNIKPVYPSTGGMGTIMFTILGICIMAISLIEYRRKMMSEK